MTEIESETSSRAYSPIFSPHGEKWADSFVSARGGQDSGLTDVETSGAGERSIVSPHSDTDSEYNDNVKEKKYSGMQASKVGAVGKIVEDERGEDWNKSGKSEDKKAYGSHSVVKTKIGAITPIEEVDRSYSISPTLTERTEHLASVKGTAISTPIHSISKRSVLSSPLATPVPVRSKNTGRLSPTAVSTPQSVSIGNQPVTLTRFNEPLKQRKGRHFVDYKIPDPTVIYVPHKRQSQGQWTNVTVERKSNGRYVVIEQRPVHTRFTDVTFSSKNKAGQDIFGGQYKLSYKREPWKWAGKENYLEKQSSKGFYEPYLPPIKQKYDTVQSKIGSMDNYDHIPGGGAHKIPSFKLKWEAESRIGSLPTTGRLDGSPISHAYTERNSLKLPEITPRYGASADSDSFSSLHYSPGGAVYIRKRKNNAKSIIGSLDNANHQPLGGDIDLPKNKVKWKSGSKVGSLDNVTHLPKSSNVQIFSEKLDWQTNSKIGSWENASHKPKKSRFHVPHFSSNWTKSSRSRVGSLVNINYKPGGGHSQIINEKISWKAKPKIDNNWKFNFDYKGLFDSSYDSESDTEFQEQTYTTQYSGTA